MEFYHVPDIKRSKTSCDLHFCNAAAAGDGSLSGLRLCVKHLQEDAEKVRQQHADLIRNLQHISAAKDRQALNLESEALILEMQEVSAAFYALHEKIDQWKDQALSRIRAVHESVSTRLRDAATADEFTKDLALADNTNDGQAKAMELRKVVGIWLRGACERIAEFERIRCNLRIRQAKFRDEQIIELESRSDDERFSENSDASDHGMSGSDSEASSSMTDNCHESLPSASSDSGHSSDEECSFRFKMRSVGDVSAGVQHLNYIVDRHMEDVMLSCWLYNDDEVLSTCSKPVCRPVASITGLPGDPSHLAFCTNTNGFVADSSGRLVRADDTPTVNCAALPNPCIFVTFQLGTAEIVEVDHIVVTSLDGGARLQWRCCEFDWNNLINGLHIDNDRQLLFIAQSRAVTVADLSGTIVSIMNAKSLGQPSAYFSEISGNNASIFLLDQDFKLLLNVNKDSCKMESTFKLAHPKCGSLLSFSLCGSRILVGDFFRGCVNKVCGVTGQQIISYPNCRTGLDKLEKVWQILADSRGGRTFVTEYDLGVIRVLAWDGSILQSIGFSPAIEERFDGAANLAIFETAERRCLAVSDQLHQRLQLFDLY